MKNKTSHRYKNTTSAAPGRGQAEALQTKVAKYRLALNRDVQTEIPFARCTMNQGVAGWKLLAVAVAIGFVTLATPILAHHGTAGYDLAKTITLNGTVTGYDWNNPHIIVYMDAKDASGTVQHWSIELAAPLLMVRRGWSKNSMKVGDQIAAEVHPARNGAPIGISGTATMLLKFTINGTPLSHM